MLAALRIWSYFRTLAQVEEEDTDTDVLYAFVAMGGNLDRTGTVKKQRLINIITVQFGLTIDIEEMLEEANIEKGKDLTYSDFMAIFGPGSSQRTSRLNSLFSVNV